MIRSLLCAAALVTALAACAPAPGNRQRAVPSEPRSPAPTTAAPTTRPSPHVSMHGARRERPRLGPYVVHRVVNGRLLDLNVDGRIRRVVALGIDVPPEGTCEARATARGARNLLAGARVYLSTDLAVRAKREWYVWTESGLYQARLIRTGYATARPDPALHLAPVLRRAETTARTGHSGLWSAATCAPGHHRPAHHEPDHRRRPEPHHPRPRPHPHHRPPFPDLTAPSALCRDGSFSFSKHRRDVCSHHHGVRRWIR